MKPELILVGGGGHCRSCIDVIEVESKYKIAGIVDIPDKCGSRVLGYEIIGCDKDFPELIKKFPNFLITLGQIKSATRRNALFNQLIEMGVTLCTIVSPMAYISRHATIGKGTIVMHGAIVNAGARVGNNCIINTKSLIEHDAVIGDDCHISTGSIVNGGTIIREKTFLGSNSVTSENIEINKQSLVGCGVRIKQSLPEGSKKVVDD
jgi:sugar O-acyltransferase (sialic acid O-acetyltransferase NeuD family)